jgi:hypothetical protein
MESGQRKKMTRILIEITKKGRIQKVFINASNDQSAAVALGVLARITNRSCWGWLRRIINRRK